MASHDFVALSSDSQGKPLPHTPPSGAQPPAKIGKTIGGGRGSKGRGSSDPLQTTDPWKGDGKHHSGLAQQMAALEVSLLESQLSASQASAIPAAQPQEDDDLDLLTTMGPSDLLALPPSSSSSSTKADPFPLFVSIVASEGLRAASPPVYPATMPNTDVAGDLSATSPATLLDRPTPPPFIPAPHPTPLASDLAGTLQTAVLPAL